MLFRTSTGVPATCELSSFVAEAVMTTLKHKIMFYFGGMGDCGDLPEDQKSTEDIVLLGRLH